jgi:hypothetical protein
LPGTVKGIVVLEVSRSAKIDRSMNPIARAGICIIEVMFVAGGIGSALVIALAGIEDLLTVFGRGTEEEEQE